MATPPTPVSRSRSGVAAGADGTIYVTDAGDADRIRRISPGGVVDTMAGGGPGFVDGPGITARFSTPSGLVVDAGGTLYVADTGNNVIRRIAPDGRVSTVAGDGTAGYRDGPASTAQFNGPIGIAADRGGRLIVADTYNDRIRVIDAAGTVTTLAGAGGVGAEDGPGHSARFHTPSGVAVASSGEIFVADTGNGVVRIIKDGVVSTASWVFPDGLARPIGIAAGPDGELYVTDDRGRVVAASPNGATRTLAGSTTGFRDGVGTEARFRNPTAIAVLGPGHLVVADAGNALVRLVAAPSALAVRPPASPRIAPRFDADAFRWQPLLWPVAPFTAPYEIAGTFGEVRGTSSERLHVGVDIRVEQGTPVHAVRDGLVSGPLSNNGFGTLTEGLRIGDLVYVHIRVGRGMRNELFDTPRFVPSYADDGTLTGIRVKRGARFLAGERIGSVNPFNHVHLNVGWPGDEYNALTFRLVDFQDTIPPTIPPNGVTFYDEHGTRLTTRVRKRLVVSGQVEVVVDAWDQADGNRPSRRLGLFSMGYQVLRPDGSPIPGFETPRETLRFDRLDANPDAASLIYAPGSGIPFYRGGRTRFLYRVTNTLRAGAVSPGLFDTTSLPAGNYTFRVWAADVRGNVAMANRDVSITVVR